MEFILVINCAFSIVGFFFIFRMWREVKSRRDFYGENFNIPRGQVSEPVQPSYDMQQLAALVANNVREPQPVAESTPSMSEGDMQKIVAAVMAAQNGGK